MNWLVDARCRDTDPELFSPLFGSADEARAKAVCGSCPVISVCLDKALTEADDTTVRGGLTAAERRALARERISA